LLATVLTLGLVLVVPAGGVRADDQGPFHIPVLSGLHGWAGINGIYDFRDGTQHGVGQNAIMMCRWNLETSTFSPVSKRGGYLQ
jgi:hypothetical protein